MGRESVRGWIDPAEAGNRALRTSCAHRRIAWLGSIERRIKIGPDAVPVFPSHNAFYGVSTRTISARCTGSAHSHPSTAPRTPAIPASPRVTVWRRWLRRRYRDGLELSRQGLLRVEYYRRLGSGAAEYQPRPTVRCALPIFPPASSSPSQQERSQKHQNDAKTEDESESPIGCMMLEDCAPVAEVNAEVAAVRRRGRSTCMPSRGQ